MAQLYYAIKFPCRAQSKEMQHLVSMCRGVSRGIVNVQLHNAINGGDINNKSKIITQPCSVMILYIIVDWIKCRKTRVCTVTLVCVKMNLMESRRCNEYPHPVF